MRARFVFGLAAAIVDAHHVQAEHPSLPDVFRWLADR
jgi:hypothetical protein